MDDYKKKKLEEYRQYSCLQDEKIQEACMLSKKADEDIQEHLKKMDKSVYVAQHANIIIPDLERQFEQSTKLDLKDYSFLFLAVALQCARMYFQPKLAHEYENTPRDLRHDAGVDGRLEKKERKEYLQDPSNHKDKSDKYMSIKKMFLYPVPYDATDGTKRIIIPGVSTEKSNLYGGNHHSATMGHDPILGYIFGVANIMTRTITFKNPTLQTCNVILDKNVYKNPNKYSKQYVTNDITHQYLFDMVIGSLKEDKYRLPAAVTRHSIHLQSDKYCKDGLPVPFISAEDAQKLIDQDWNSQELWNFSKAVIKDLSVQAFFSILVNVLVEQIHKLSYKEDCGVTRDLYSVKTHKILEASNVIASSTNIMYTALSKDFTKLDLGGLCVTLYRICKDESVIKKIKEEFVKGSYFDMLRG